MPILRVYEGLDMTVEVSRTGIVSIQFWDEYGKPKMKDEIEFTSDEWLYLIHLTVDLMSPSNFDESIKDAAPDMMRNDAE